MIKSKYLDTLIQYNCYEDNENSVKLRDSNLRERHTYRDKRDRERGCGSEGGGGDGGLGFRGKVLTFVYEQNHVILRPSFPYQNDVVKCVGSAVFSLETPNSTKINK